MIATLSPARLIPLEHRRGLLVVDAQAACESLRDRRPCGASSVPPHLSQTLPTARPVYGVWHFSQTVRPLRRRTISSLSMSNASTASTVRFSDLSIVASPSACGTVRTTPSRITPRAYCGCASSSRDDAEDHRVGHEIAAIHERLGLEAERACPPRTRRAKHVAGGERRNVELLGEQRRLRALSGAWLCRRER